MPTPISFRQRSNSRFAAIVHQCICLPAALRATSSSVICVARTPLCTDHCNLRAPVHFFWFWKEHLGKPAALKLIEYMLTAWVGWSHVSNPAGIDKKGISTTYSPSLGNEQYWQGKIRLKSICFCLYFSFYPEVVWKLHRKRNERRKKPGFTFSFRWQLCSFQQTLDFLPG